MCFKLSGSDSKKNSDYDYEALIDEVSKSNNNNNGLSSQGTPVQIDVRGTTLKPKVEQETPAWAFIEEEIKPKK